MSIHDDDMKIPTLKEAEKAAFAGVERLERLREERQNIRERFLGPAPTPSNDFTKGATVGTGASYSMSDHNHGPVLTSGYDNNISINTTNSNAIPAVGPPPGYGYTVGGGFNISHSTFPTFDAHDATRWSEPFMIGTTYFLICNDCGSSVKGIGHWIDVHEGWHATHPTYIIEELELRL